MISSPVRSSLVRLLDGVPAPVASRFDSTGWASRLIRPLVNRLVPSNATSITVRSGPAKGVRLLIDPSSEKYYWTGTYERGVQNALVELLRPGQTFWDVGAHIGFFSLLASRLVGEIGRVEAFEPLPLNQARLESALELNDAHNVRVHHCALAGARGRRKLHGHEASSMWTLLPELPDDGMSLEVECRTADDLVCDLGAPDVMKIDVEGAEVDALRGASELLTSHQPRLIVEFSDSTAVRKARLRLSTWTFERLGEHQWLVVAK
jgi:FkbM family methyltransferase